MGLKKLLTDLFCYSGNDLIVDPVEKYLEDAKAPTDFRVIQKPEHFFTKRSDWSEEDFVTRGNNCSEGIAGKPSHNYDVIYGDF